MLYQYGLCFVSEIYPFQCISAPLSLSPIMESHWARIRQLLTSLFSTRAPFSSHRASYWFWLTFHTAWRSSVGWIYTLWKENPIGNILFITGLLCKCFTRLVLHISVQIHVQLKKIYLSWAKTYRQINGRSPSEIMSPFTWILLSWGLIVYKTYQSYWWQRQISNPWCLLQPAREDKHGL